MVLGHATEQHTDTPGESTPGHWHSNPGGLIYQYDIGPDAGVWTEGWAQHKKMTKKMQNAKNSTHTADVDNFFHFIL